MQHKRTVHSSSTGSAFVALFLHTILLVVDFFCNESKLCAIDLYASIYIIGCRYLEKVLAFFVFAAKSYSRAALMPIINTVCLYKSFFEK